ncbi:hypothetical protein Rhe02_07250 [Rhizocola hellebori]|uniref:HTH cro/C1-type domain-containing protein n=1 Tax=Rhizocola hellebori TaxID=1392758 RepID=A0A8J3Q2H1_9ACTN|nr:helix-turn-helix domain-containing protein [Rhizocola hellebori]GIH02658.1 hypothetical protein Rhe02_07250 [Rhizocola hellebori]
MWQPQRGWTTALTRHSPVLQLNFGVVRWPERGVLAVFGELVRGHRRRLGFTQEDLAAKTGVHSRTIAKIEVGQIATPRQTTVRLLADAFALAGSAREAFFEAASESKSAPVTPPQSSPNMLPAHASVFVGRQEHLRSLDAGDNQAVTVIGGTAGVGKTALALHWAHRVRDRYPDGLMYINLRGFDPAGSAMGSAEAIRRFLDALAVPPQRIPADPDAQADLYRTKLAAKKMLIVLDNARDPDQVRPLLPGTPSCRVLVTSRNKLTGLVAAQGAHPLPLDLLTFGEARQLLTHRLGAARVASDPDAVEELITGCARLPLALNIVAAHAAIQPQLALSALAGQLRLSRDRLDTLSTSDTPTTDVRSVFSWSYQALRDGSARLFRLLGLHPGPDISAAAAASLAGLPAEKVRPLLSELASAHLITEHTVDRYDMHDLLRVYAAEQTHRHDSDAQRHAAIGRILDHYLHTAYLADRMVSPARDPLALTPPLPGVSPEHVAGYGQAMDWFAAEHAVLLATVDHAAATGSDTHTWQLSCSLANFLNRRGHWHDWAHIQQAAVVATQRLADPSAQARAHRLLAQAYTWLGRFDDAYAQLWHALDLARQSGDPIGQAHAHYSLSLLSHRQDLPHQALDHAQQALDLHVAANHRRGQARALNSVGWFHAQVGRHSEALAYCLESLVLHQELGDRAGEANAWDSVGYAHHLLGHHADAVTCYQRAIDRYSDLGDRYHEADTLTHLGDTHHATNNVHATRLAWQQALEILRQLDHPDAERVRTKLHGL